MRNLAITMFDKKIQKLFKDAWDNNSLQTILCLVRATGMSIGHWDPLLESLDSFSDYASIINDATSLGNRKRILRMKFLYLHIYIEYLPSSSPNERMNF